MGNGGISIGRPGGLTPGESIKKPELGPAKTDDVLQFQEALGQPGQAKQISPDQTATQIAQKASMVEEPASPFNFHPDIKSLVPKKGGIAKGLIDISKNITLSYQNIADNLKNKTSFSAADTIKMQFDLNQLSIYVEAVSKGVGKVVTGLQTVIKQQ